MPALSSISVVIPAFNEARRLPQTLERIVAFAASRPELREIIVVDDGSSDATGKVVEEFASRHPVVRPISYGANRGKGFAIRTGILASTCDYVLISDADLSTPIEELDTLAAAIGDRRIAIGSRAVDPSRVRLRQAWHRQWMGKTFNRIMRALTGLPFRDTQCGFKLFRGDDARTIFAEARVDRFAYDVEALMLAMRRGIGIVEVPVLWFNSPDSRVHVARDSTRMLADVIRIRLRLGSVRNWR
ncbi:MAG: dolichyl-phosphate beta-glucosyltransferase [Thermoanaerobaculia bacterium]